MEKTKKEILLFLGLLIIFSGLSYIPIWRSTDPNVYNGPVTLLLVYCPFLAAIITKLISDRNIRKLGWKPGKLKYLLLSLAIPVIYGIVVYGFAWVTKIGVVRDHIKIGLGSGLPVSLDFLIFCILGLLTRAIGAFGEEVGWRGFLTPRLYKLTNMTTASIIIGLIWVIWHIPLLIMTSYGGAFSVYKLIIFTIGLVSISFALTWLRIRSGSLWIGVFMHSSNNFFIQNVFDQIFTEKGGTSFFLTETGIGMSISAIVLAYIFWKLRNKLPQPEIYSID